MDGTVGTQPSIHRQRRGWYLVWTTLLVLALVFLAVWEIPGSRGVGHVSIALKNPLPRGSQADWWAGSGPDWKGRTDVFQGSTAGPEDLSKPFTLPLIEITAGMRRFNLGYVPRCTSDRIVIRFRIPQEADRFLSYDLRGDMRQGFIGPHRRMYLRIPLSWEKLSKDAVHPTQLQ